MLLSPPTAETIAMVLLVPLVAPLSDVKGMPQGDMEQVITCWLPLILTLTAQLPDGILAKVRFTVSPKDALVLSTVICGVAGTPCKFKVTDPSPNSTLDPVARIFIVIVLLGPFTKPVAELTVKLEKFIAELAACRLATVTLDVVKALLFTKNCTVRFWVAEFRPERLLIVAFMLVWSPLLNVLCPLVKVTDIPSCPCELCTPVMGIVKTLLCPKVFPLLASTAFTTNQTDQS